MTEPREPAPRTGPQSPPDGAPPGAVSSGGAAWEPTGGMGNPGDPAQFLAALGRSWLWILGSAIVTLVAGIIVLVWPDGTLHVLAVLIGLYLLAAGVFRFVGAFGREDHGERLSGLLLAVLYVLGGVLCLRNPLQTIAALSLIVGAVWLVSGIVTLYTAVAARNLPHRGVVIGAAALAVVAGVVVLALPAESARALTRLLGLWLVLLGLVEVATALAWRAALRGSGVTGGRGGAAGPA